MKLINGEKEKFNRLINKVFPTFKSNLKGKILEVKLDKYPTLLEDVSTDPQDPYNELERDVDARLESKDTQIKELLTEYMLQHMKRKKSTFYQKGYSTQNKSFIEDELEKHFNYIYTEYEEEILREAEILYNRSGGGRKKKLKKNKSRSNKSRNNKSKRKKSKKKKSKKY